MSGIEAGYCSLNEYRAGKHDKPPVMGEHPRRNPRRGFYTAMFTLGGREKHKVAEAARYPAWLRDFEALNASGLYKVQLELLDVNLETTAQAETLFANGYLVAGLSHLIMIGKQPVNGGYLREDEIYSIPRDGNQREVVERGRVPFLIPGLAPGLAAA